MTTTKYMEALQNKALRFDHIYDEYIHNGLFIQGLDGSIPHIMQSYWSLKKTAMVHDLALHATSLTNFQYGSRV